MYFTHCLACYWDIDKTKALNIKYFYAVQIDKSYI